MMSICTVINVGETKKKRKKKKCVEVLLPRDTDAEKRKKNENAQAEADVCSREASSTDGGVDGEGGHLTERKDFYFDGCR